MNYRIWDIETLALPPDQLPPFDETSVAMGNLKDESKRAAKLAEAKAEYVTNAALSPMTGRVAMVGFDAKPKPLIICCESEAETISQAFDIIFQHLAASERVVGFNCFSFDLPFLIKRAWALGLKVPGILRTRYRGRSYWDENLIDLREEWLLGERAPAKGTSSLDALAKFLGLPPKLGSGADFAALNMEQRKDYLTRDLEVTEALYLKLFDVPQRAD